MAPLWYGIVSVMLALYAVLDGFDFGAGILHLFVARSDVERRTVLAAIGPIWDGNEVWLIASGGVLVFAFPRVYAVGFSGFYLPLMMALWLLILRGVSIEFRSLEHNTLWRSFWDGMFWFSSSLTAFILGAALGNVIRGVPIDATGYFSGPLFTTFRPGPRPGVLDWYTALIGVFALATLAAHGATFLWWKTTEQVQNRSLIAAKQLWAVVFAISIPATAATAHVQPAIYSGLIARPWTWILAAGIAASLVLVVASLRRHKELPAFLASCAFITCLLAATAAGLYPVLLSSTLSPAYDLTEANSATGNAGLRVGLIWWTLALMLVIVYFTYLFRSFRGKVTTESLDQGHGY